jgi:phage protein U
MLGGFKFSLNTAVFQQLQHSTSYRWPAQERIGQLDALQFTGPGEDRITLPGIVYPDFRGDANQIAQLRTLASGGRPLRLIAATGDILGLWVIESMDETQSAFKPDGTARRQEFTLTMRKFSDDANV